MSDTAIPGGQPAPAAQTVAAPATAAPATPVTAPAVSVAAPAAAPVAAPAAPATPAVPASPVTIPAAPAASAQPVTFEATGSAEVDAVLAHLADKQVAVPKEALAALQTGDVSLFEKLFDEKGLGGKDVYVNLLKEGHQKAQAKAEATAAMTKGIIDECVGGEENWKSVVQFIQKEATEGEREAINSMLTSGNALQVRAAGLLLNSMYQNFKDSNASAGKPSPNTPPRSAVSDTAGRGPSSDGGPLSPDDFRAARLALLSKIGSRALDSSPEYQALVARRRAFK